MVRLGGDLSNYDWPFTAETVAGLRAGGWEEAIVGCQYPDTARQQIALLRSGGIEVSGVYAFLYFGGDTLGQVRNAIAVAKEFGITRVWLDCELDWLLSSPSSRAQELRASIAAVEAAGLSAGIYTGKWWWQGHMPAGDEFAKYPLWHASYWDDRHLQDTVDYGGWTKVAVHQYASEPELAGRNRDYDAFFEEAEVPTQTEWEDLILALFNGGSTEAKLPRDQRLSLCMGRLANYRDNQGVADVAESAMVVAKQKASPLPDHKHGILWKDMTGGVIS